MENKYIINILRRQQRTDKFKIVDTFPLGYIVWPIGRENFPFPGYIPLAKPHAGKLLPAFVVKDADNTDIAFFAYRRR